MFNLSLDLFAYFLSENEKMFKMFFFFFFRNRVLELDLNLNNAKNDAGILLFVVMWGSDIIKI